MNTSTGLFVKSHVTRDLLQNAALFKSDKVVVWEYVSNGLQYVGSGTNPLVKVALDSKKKRISIKDNGRGMDMRGLQNFFVMHGENIDRKEGRPGRGRFGTGKSAAFGIAEVLRITTVRNGKRSKVELKRSEVERMTSDAPIPVEILEDETPTSSANGTLVEIEGIHLRSLDQGGIIRYIERHLAKSPKNATVLVNNHECEFTEPPIASEHRFNPEGANAALLGDIELVVKVSKLPLEDDLRGISIFSHGVWHETTLAGSEGREMAQYIFGEVDVPKLDEDKSPIDAFDVSRSMRLNPENDLVRAIHAFVGMKIEEVRRALLEAEKRRRAEEDAKKLAQQASEIARVINEDFDAFRQRVAKVRARSRGSSDLDQNAPTGGEEENDLIFGAEVPANQTLPEGGPGGVKGGGKGTETSNQNPTVEAADSSAPKLGRGVGGTGTKRKPAGGFDVKFREMGEAAYRAQYISDERTIYINLQHPQVAAALGNASVDEPLFRRLAYEIAFFEYTVALAQEMIRAGACYDLTDPVFEIREAMNRLARKGAALYGE
jgi:hypothetical protein